MRISINNIKQYTGISITLDELLHILASKIGEVEGHQDWSEIYKGVYIAEIVSKKEHPDADKLGIYEINIGEKEKVQVVAGDKGLEVGDKVAYIKPGNIVPSTYKSSEEFVIKAVKMRGILSNGMLCSQKELNIGPDHTTVYVLEPDAPVGEPFATYYDFNDTVVDIENKALTNRGDLFGIIGIAREISGAKGIPFVSPQWYKETKVRKVERKDTLPLEIQNNASAICPRYIGVVMDNIHVQQSPVWLKSILLKSDIRPINNVVDITNYLSILIGQPLHAFDYDKLVKGDTKGNGNAQITIRLAKDGESIHTLDDSMVTLTSNNLVIADSTNPLAIAGVIGGSDTQIDENTKRIVIECANFDRFNIRRTSMSLGIFTDAVTRFTKALDPNQCLPVITYAISLVEELAEGEMASDIVDVYPEISEPKTISLSITKLNTHLGTQLTKEDISTILENLEYEISKNSESEDYLTVTPPTFRNDISIAEDIHEDIGRMYGYENISPILPLRDVSANPKNKILDLKNRVRNILSNSGANEIITYSFVGKEVIEKSNQDPNLAFHIKNAISPELSLMRTSLTTSLLSKAQENIQRNIPTFCMYEFNITHQKGNMDNFELPKEQWYMSLLFTTKEDLFEGSPYFQAKRYLEKVLTTLDMGNIKYKLITKYSERDLPIWITNLVPTFNPKASAYILYKDTVLGIIGEYDSKVIDNFKLPKYSSGLELSIDQLLKIQSEKKIYINSSKYPAIYQDITFVVNMDMEYSTLSKIILDSINTEKRKASIECLDIYSKGDGTKNITIRISVEHEDKTLNDKDFEKLKKKILTIINRKQ